MWTLLGIILFLGFLMETYWIIIPLILFFIGIGCEGIGAGFLFGGLSFIILFGIYKWKGTN